MGRKLIEHPIYTILFASFAFLIVLPVFYTLTITFFAEGSLSDNLQLLNKSIFLLLAKSCFIAFSIAILSTIFGTVLALLLYKTDFVYRNFFKIALLIPLFISPYILAVAWKDFFYLFLNNAGLITSNAGVILVLTFIFTPLSMIIIGSALTNINAQLEETGFVITNYYRVILKITLPIIKPALITSFVLIFIFSISEFSVPAFFGVKVFTTEIFTQFSAFYNHSLAILQSALLIVICVLLLYADRKHLADAPFFSVSEKGTSSKLYSFKKLKWLSRFYVSGWFFISVVLPFVVLFVQSFENGTAKFIQAFGLLKPTFGTSIWLAFTGAVITAFIGFVAAYVSEIKKKKSFDWLLLFVFAIPSTIFGISLIKFYNHPAFDFIYSGYAILLIGYTGKFSFISAKLIGNAIKQIPYSLEEAAQIEGIGFYRRLQAIIIPLIMPALFAAFIINFIFFLGELGTTIMLYPPGTEIMPVKVFTIMANAPQSLVSSSVIKDFTVDLKTIFD
ncbi:MAG: hypothetical protein B6D61_02525 [Bacteroidetes bacterium 4484_249]|nr:MAG: hypothetical protein B6D61_02525 [Bacteroidetes bacterium 4484_249]